MKQCKKAGINGIGQQPAHAGNGGLLIITIAAFLGNKDINDKGAYISNKYTGRRMKAGLMPEAIEGKTQYECNNHQPSTLYAKWKP